MKIFSTDCDFIVIGYGYEVNNGHRNIKTKEFFNLFGYKTKEEVLSLPEYLGCDYNSSSHKITDIGT